MIATYIGTLYAIGVASNVPKEDVSILGVTFSMSKVATTMAIKAAHEFSDTFTQDTQDLDMLYPDGVKEYHLPVLGRDLYDKVITEMEK